jgi:uncharacterized protein YjdB
VLQWHKQYQEQYRLYRKYNYILCTSGGTWSSTLAVATVDSASGVVTGVAAGTSVINYSVTTTGGCVVNTASRTVTVSAPMAQTVSEQTPFVSKYNNIL